MIIDCVVGSGKTTTILEIAKKYPELEILVLVYNKRLRKETIRKSTFPNLDIHTFHSFFYHRGHEVTNDFELLDMISLEHNNDYDLIIIDEAQDITSLYYQVIKAIILGNSPKKSKKCLISLFGDTRQCIYRYNKSDHRYLVFADTLFNLNNVQWIRLTLSTSYRLTKGAAHFLHICDPLIKINTVKQNSSKDDIRYIICDTLSNRCIEEVLYYKNLGYNYRDIMIVAPSLKGLKRMINRMSEVFKIPISCSNNNETSALSNKVLISTFHQAKGLERSVVIVTSFDNSYFIFYNKKNKSFTNSLYVALTRSTERLSLIHNYKMSCMPFLRPNYLDVVLNKLFYVEYYNDLKFKDLSDKYRNTVSCNISVTDVLKHIDIETSTKILSYVKIQCINGPQNKVGLGSIVYDQFVDDLNGIIIPMYHEYKNKGYSTIDKIASQEVYNYYNVPDVPKFLDLSMKDTIIEKLSKSALKWSCILNGLRYRLHSFSTFNWISKSDLDTCMERLDKHISKDAEYEVQCHNNFFDKVLTGSIDCISNNDLWEFKCVEKLDESHIIQVVLYVYLRDNYTSNNYLFNILTNELYKVTVPKDSVPAILKLLYTKDFHSEVNDAEFLRMNS